MDICELPVDVANKIVSYYLGEPEYMRLKHNKMLKKYKENLNHIILKKREKNMNILNKCLIAVKLI